MHTRLRGVIASVAVFSVMGCAETTFKKANTTSRQGIRYYHHATYILLKPDYANGTVSILTFQAPDTTTMYSANPYSWIATNTMELTFAHGMLTKVISKPDSTKSAVDVVGALSAIASKSLEAAAANAAKVARRTQVGASSEPPIYLFKVEGAQLTPVSLEGKIPAGGAPRK